jgi:hypothetical protein
VLGFFGAAGSLTAFFVFFLVLVAAADAVFFTFFYKNVANYMMEYIIFTIYLQFCLCRFFSTFIAAAAIVAC